LSVRTLDPASPLRANVRTHVVGGARWLAHKESRVILFIARVDSGIDDGGTRFGLFRGPSAAKKGQLVLDGMRARGSATARQVAGSRAEKVGFERFFRNQKVTVEEMLETAVAATAKLAAGRHILLIEDTSEINFESKAGRKRNLGTVGNGTDVGLFVHPVLAVDANDGSVLGLSGAEVWRRKKCKQKNYESLPIEEKESYRWIGASQLAETALESASCVTLVMDREADIYEVLAGPCAPNVKKLVRATQNRALADQGRLFAAVSAQNEAGRILLDLPMRPGRAARKGAPLAVRYTHAELRQPRNGADRRYPKTALVNIIEAREIDPPSNKDTVHWRLLTTHEVGSFEDAVHVIELYRKRWIIEQLFRTMKSSAFDIEASFVEDGEALERIAVAALIASADVLKLVYGRGEAGRAYPATRVFNADEIRFIHLLVKKLEGKTEKQKNPHPPGTLAWAGWCVARLGGWNGYAKERPPGPITFANGIQRFRAMADGFLLASSEVKNVCLR
jgi:Transposase DDE domain